MACLRELVFYSLVLLGLNLCGLCVDGVLGKWDDFLRMPTYSKHGGGNGGNGGVDDDGDDDVGTKWVVLIVGSMGSGNYRHQVCALQHLRTIKC